MLAEEHHGQRSLSTFSSHRWRHQRKQAPTTGTSAALLGTSTLEIHGCASWEAQFKIEHLDKFNSAALNTARQPN